jgi:3-phosphoshikimate 1-carboxyvinyltransferase
VPSAQIKSAILLAALAAPGITTVIESEASRDHTERLLVHFGAEVTVAPDGEHGRKITLKGEPELAPAPVVVPADPSSAAFPMVAALIVPGSEVILTDVMTNPLRTGLVTTLREMGARIEALNVRSDVGEEMADFRVRASALRGAVRAGARPLIAASVCRWAWPSPTRRDVRPQGAAREDRSPGRGRRRPQGERRRGRDRRRRPDRARPQPRGRRRMVATHMDHRIAMAFLVMGSRASGR